MPINKDELVFVVMPPEEARKLTPSDRMYVGDYAGRSLYVPVVRDAAQGGAGIANPIPTVMQVLMTVRAGGEYVNVKNS